MRIRRRCRGRSRVARGRRSTIERGSFDAESRSRMWRGMEEDIGGKPRTARSFTSAKLLEILQVAAA